jgi:hypothetical protein
MGLLRIAILFPILFYFNQSFAAHAERENPAESSIKKKTKDKDEKDKKIIKLRRENKRLEKQIKTYENIIAEYEIIVKSYRYMSVYNLSITTKSEPLNLANEYQQNNLQLAIRNNKDAEASELIRSGINLYHTDSNDRTALQYAVQMGKKSLVIEILAAGFDVNYVTKAQHTILDERMSLEMLDLLLAKGLKPQGKRGLENFFNQGGLFHPNNYQLLDQLLKRGLDPNAAFMLHQLASTKPQKPMTEHVAKMVALLLQNGANPHLRNHLAKTPLEIAEETYSSFLRPEMGPKPSNKNVMTFRAANSWKPGEECAICFQKISFIKAATATCHRHLFHSACLKEWSQRSKQCPICRNPAS